jgi:hypothetical protein
MNSEDKKAFYGLLPMKRSRNEPGAAPRGSVPGERCVGAGIGN